MHIHAVNYPGFVQGDLLNLHGKIQTEESISRGHIHILRISLEALRQIQLFLC